MAAKELKERIENCFRLPVNHFNAKSQGQSATDPATEEFEQEQTEITEKKKRGEKLCRKRTILVD